MNLAFETLSTKHKQNNFFKDHGDFEEPVEIKDDVNKQIIGFVIPFKPKLVSLMSLPEAEHKPSDHMEILRVKNIKCLLSDGTYIKQLIEKVLKNFVNTIFTLLVTTV